jgi:hypothetical protein
MLKMNLVLGKALDGVLGKALAPRLGKAGVMIATTGLGNLKL